MRMGEGANLGGLGKVPQADTRGGAPVGVVLEKCAQFGQL